MKIKLLLTTILLNCIAVAFAQKTYMYAKDLGMQDSLTYEKNKEAYKTKFSSLLSGPDARLDENLEIVRKTKDSIIYEYKWIFNLSKNKVNSENKVTEQATKFELIEKNLKTTQFKTNQGKKFDMKSLHGKPTLLNFWFTKCAPCIDEMPALNELRNKYKDQVNFIAITYNTSKEVNEFLKKHSYDFIQIVDAKNFTDAIKIDSYPKNIFIDKNGKITKIVGGIPYKLNDKKELVIEDTKIFETILNKLL
jgi:cytochrome c biogenesis protein CcmG, thiol:disulfide interchange protein DsbE